MKYSRALDHIIRAMTLIQAGKVETAAESLNDAIESPDFEDTITQLDEAQADALGDITDSINAPAYGLSSPTEQSLEELTRGEEDDGDYVMNQQMDLASRRLKNKPKPSLASAIRSEAGNRMAIAAKNVNALSRQR